MTTRRQLSCSSQGRLAGVGRWSSIALWLGTATACGSAPPSEHEVAYARSMSPTVELATTPAEELALERAATLAPGEPADLGGDTVVAGPIYPAASGRRCREMTIADRHRLACEDPEADVWVFVPDVFTTSIGSGGEAPVSGDAPVDGDAAESPAPETAEGAS